MKQSNGLNVSNERSGLAQFNLMYLKVAINFSKEQKKEKEVKIMPSFRTSIDDMVNCSVMDSRKMLPKIDEEIYPEEDYLVFQCLFNKWSS